MTGSVRVGVLGPLSVAVDGRPQEAPRAEVVRGLLGVLLLAGREPLSVERLISLVWDDRAGHTRPASVHVAVTRLRGWLDEVGLAAEVRREGCGYRLAHEFDLDLDRLARVGRARGAGGGAVRCGWPRRSPATAARCWRTWSGSAGPTRWCSVPSGWCCGAAWSWPT